MKGERNACAPLAPHGVRSTKRLALAKGKLLRSMRGSGLRRESPLRGAGVVLGEIRPCNGKGCAFHAVNLNTRGIALGREWCCVPDAGAESRRESPLRRAGVVLARSPACLAMTFTFSQRVALRAGEGEMLWACGPSDLPFQPLGAPRWAFRAATARMVRSALGKSRRAPHLLAKAVTQGHPSSHAPRADGHCPHTRLRGKSFGPPERWAREGATSGGGISEVLPLFIRMGAERGRCARDAKGGLAGQRSRKKRNTRRPKKQGCSGCPSPEAPLRVRRPLLSARP